LDRAEFHPPNSLDEWTASITRYGESDDQPEIDARLTPYERAEEAIAASFIPTRSEAYLTLWLFHQIRLIFAGRGRTLAEFQQQFMRMLTWLSEAEKKLQKWKNSDGELVLGQLLALGRMRSSAAICAPLPMRIEKMLMALCQQMGKYHDHPTTWGFGERDGIARERRAVIPQVPLLPVPITSAATRKSFGEAMLFALGTACGLGDVLLTEEQSKPLSLQCNPWSLLMSLARGGVAFVAPYGLRHEMQAPLPTFWELLRLFRECGFGVLLAGSPSLARAEAGPHFSALFPRRPEQIIGYAVADVAEATDLAARYWRLLGVPAPMPAVIVTMVRSLLGQREWIELAFRELAEHIFLRGEEPELAAAAVAREVLLDVQAPLDALHRYAQGELSHGEQLRWQDYLPLPSAR
jgi:hypothetical protein